MFRTTHEPRLVARSRQMDLGCSERAQALQKELERFLEEEVYPAEPEVAERRAAGKPYRDTVQRLQAAARSRGLWNLYLRSTNGLSNVDYGHLAELTGRSPDLAPAAINGAAPDSVNMVMLDAVASEEQRRMWLEPLLAGETQSAFAMTEPDVASSDANNISTRIERDGDEYVITGRKWYISGAARPSCSVLFVMGVSNPDGDRHRRHSIVGVPIDTPGVEVLRPLPVFGYPGDPAEIEFSGARVPVEFRLGEEGMGFRVAQTRLAAARLHHSMRLVGLAERALSLAARRSGSRRISGGALAANSVFRSQIAECRLGIDQARLMVLRAAWECDSTGQRAAQTHISAAKIVATRTALTVLDRAVGIHGAMGVSEDSPLARWWASARALHIADGPEEVHLEVVARSELSSIGV